MDSGDLMQIALTLLAGGTFANTFYVLRSALKKRSKADSTSSVDAPDNATHRESSAILNVTEEGHTLSFYDEKLAKEYLNMRNKEAHRNGE